MTKELQADCFAGLYLRYLTDLDGDVSVTRADLTVASRPLDRLHLRGSASYDERTRLMTWRVAILALTILVSGGLSPVIRNQLGPEWGYRGVGLFVGTLILIGTVGAWWSEGTRTGVVAERLPSASTATTR